MSEVLSQWDLPRDIREGLNKGELTGEQMQRLLEHTGVAQNVAIPARESRFNKLLEYVRDFFFLCILSVGYVGWVFVIAAIIGLVQDR